MLKKPAVGSVFVHFRDDDTDSQTKKEERNIKLNNEKRWKGEVDRKGGKMVEGKEGKMCS